MIAQTAPELFSKTKTEWVEEARQVAEKLLRTQPSITIMDVLAVHPLPGYIKKNVLGSVFHHSLPVFRKVDIERSRSKAAHGHYISRWALKEELYHKSYFTWKKRNLEEDGRGD